MFCCRSGGSWTWGHAPQKILKIKYLRLAKKAFPKIFQLIFLLSRKGRLTNLFFPRNVLWTLGKKRPLDTWGGGGGGEVLPSDVSLTPKNIYFSQLIICCWFDLDTSSLDYMTGNRQHVNHLLRDRQLENFLMCSADQYLSVSCGCRPCIFKLLNDRQL